MLLAGDRCGARGKPCLRPLSLPSSAVRLTAVGQSERRGCCCSALRDELAKGLDRDAYAPPDVHDLEFAVNLRIKRALTTVRRVRLCPLGRLASERSCGTVL
jgi:hypothetical protein